MVLANHVFKLKIIQEKCNGAKGVWSKGWDTINDKYESGFEKNKVLELINGKISSLNDVHNSLNELYRVV
jgi:hypothetical protein